MPRLFQTPHGRDIMLGAGLLSFAASLLRWPQECAQAARDALSLCGHILIPSLFPFFVLSFLVVELGLSRYPGKLLEGIMFPLFRISGAGASALVLGLVGGYPVGARTAVSLYQSGQCSKAETERLLAFCNNAGPAFILSVVGSGLLGSVKLGLILYGIHAAASLLVGFLFRFYGTVHAPCKRTPVPVIQAVSFSTAFTCSVTSAFHSALNLCAFVLFFSILIRILHMSGAISAALGALSQLFSPISLTLPFAPLLLPGFLEISSGISALSGAEPLSCQMILAAFMLGWAGLSVHCQVLSFLVDSGLSPRFYFAGKLLHGCISAVLAALAVNHLDLDLPASATPLLPITPLSWSALEEFLTISVLLAIIAWALFSLPVFLCAKKSSGNGKHHAL